MSHKSYSRSDDTAPDKSSSSEDISSISSSSSSSSRPDYKLARSAIKGGTTGPLDQTVSSWPESQSTSTPQPWSAVFCETQWPRPPWFSPSCLIQWSMGEGSYITFFFTEWRHCVSQNWVEFLESFRAHASIGLLYCLPAWCEGWRSNDMVEAWLNQLLM